MKIELEVRYIKARELSPEEKEEEEYKKEERRIRKLTDKYGTEEDSPESFDFAQLLKKYPVEFIYKNYVLDSGDILGFYPLDETHTVLVTDAHGELAIRVPYDIWKNAYENLVGESIRSITHSKIEAKQRKIK